MPSKKRVLELVLLSLAVLGPSEAVDFPSTTTAQGAIRGAYHEASDGRRYSAFMSLPFAQPPLGELRFKAPVEAEGWKGVRDASQDSPVCIQNNPYIRSNEVYGDEDCLYLNVYTPKDLENNDGELWPVMVFFHGGGWMTGSGNEAHYGPDRLMQRNVVLVGVNYRLGALGLLSTMDNAAPGNWLFKDQQMALYWIKKNIKNFGGDPNLVTIFGESAGATSVHYHIMSPKSKGLFHRAILHSGCALCDWGNSAPGHPEKQAKKLGKVMNCPTDNSESMIKCLRTKKAEDLIAADKYFYDWDFDPMIPFRPVVEPENEHSFITEDPRLILKEGRFAQVPMMWGINANEGAIRATSIMGVPGLLDEFIENFDDLAPVTFSYWNSDSDDSKIITDAIKSYYLKDFKNIKKNQDIYMKLSDIYSDAYFSAGIDEALRLMIPKTTQNTYFYHFIFRGKSSFTEAFGDSTRDYGACHVDELLYLFNIKLFPDLNENEKNISDAMLTIWTNFAKSGNPNKPITYTKIGNIPKWNKMTRGDIWNHLDIGSKLQLGTDLIPDRRRYWRSLPLWEKKHSVIYKKSPKIEL